METSLQPQRALNLFITTATACSPYRFWLFKFVGENDSTSSPNNEIMFPRLWNALPYSTGPTCTIGITDIGSIFQLQFQWMYFSKIQQESIDTRRAKGRGLNCLGSAVENTCYFRGYMVIGLSLCWPRMWFSVQRLSGNRLETQMTIIVSLHVHRISFQNSRLTRFAIHLRF